VTLIGEVNAVVGMILPWNLLRWEFFRCFAAVVSYT